MNPSHANPALPKAEHSLLVVDDNPVNRKLACAFAARSGWKATEADGGKTALALLTETRFDLVLLDISMPGLSGEEVLERLRATPGLEQQRVVAYTAHALPEEQRRLLEAGFDGLLIKPITLQALSDILKAAAAPA
jgi:CheY-like chemotaxis protein